MSEKKFETKTQNWNDLMERADEFVGGYAIMSGPELKFRGLVTKMEFLGPSYLLVRIENLAISEVGQDSWSYYQKQDSFLCDTTLAGQPNWIDNKEVVIPRIPPQNQTLHLYPKESTEPEETLSA